MSAVSNALRRRARSDPEGAQAARRSRPSGPARLGDVARTSAVDFYYQSIRIIPANVAWGVAVVGWLGVVAFVSPVIGLVVSPFLAIPFAGVMRLGALIARGEDVVLGDVASAWRIYAIPAIGAGVVMVAIAVTLGANVVTGALAGGPAGWAFAALAGWGLVAAWVVGLSFWSILVDPARDHLSTLAKARLAVASVLAFPARFGFMGLFLAVVTVASAIAVVALLTIGVGYVALVATRFTLSASDSVERWVNDGATTSL